MNLTFVPLLQIQRELYGMPRGMERFRAYLKTMLNGEADDLDLAPLVLMNPMARDHVVERLDELQVIGAEAIAHDAVREAEKRLVAHRPELKRRVGLVVVDDVRGGWTNRYFTEASCTFAPRRISSGRQWISIPIWASEPVSSEGVRRATLHAVHYGVMDRPISNGGSISLRDILDWEGQAAAFAGFEQWLDLEDLAYTRAVVTSYLDATDFPTQFTCMFGDEAARKVGYAPLGLSVRAGFALALYQVGDLSKPHWQI